MFPVACEIGGPPKASTGPFKDGSIIAISADNMVRVPFMGVSDHLKERMRLLNAINGPRSIELLICLNVSITALLQKCERQKLVQLTNRERMIWRSALKTGLLWSRKGRLIEATHLMTTMLRVYLRKHEELGVVR